MLDPDPVSGQAPAREKAWKAFEKAYASFSSGRWEECESELRKAIRFDSTFADAYILRGDLYLETGKPGDAIDQYEYALNYKPENVEIVYNLLANTLFSLERYPESLVYYDKLVDYPGIDPDLLSVIKIKREITAIRKELVGNPVPLASIVPDTSVVPVSD